MVQIGRIKATLVCCTEGELVLSLVRQATGLSQNNARRLLERGKVYVAGRPCLDWRTALAAGTEVSIDTDRRSPGRLPELGADAVVHVDHSFVVVNKPAGLVSVPPTRTGEPTLLDLLNAQLAGPDGPGDVVALHRLDRETRGLMLFGLARGDPKALVQQFRRHEVVRSYYAVVEGAMTATRIQGRIDVTRPQRGAKPTTRFADTTFEVPRCGPRSLVICRPHTGRYHQLRIQLANAGHPIVGDRVHGRRYPRSVPMALQSFSVALHRPEDGALVQWEIPLEPELEALLTQGEKP